MNWKRKTILTAAFFVSLLPMFLSWFGIGKGIQEIKGWIVLENPVALLCVLIFPITIWVDFKAEALRKIVPVLSLLGIIGVEIYEFIAWHHQTVTGSYSLKFSFETAYPEFYFGLIVSIAMLAFYLWYRNRKQIQAKK